MGRQLVIAWKYNLKNCVGKEKCKIMRKIDNIERTDDNHR